MIRNKHLTRTLMALTLGVSLAGCAKAPTSSPAAPAAPGGASVTTPAAAAAAAAATGAGGSAAAPAANVSGGADSAYNAPAACPPGAPPVVAPAAQFIAFTSFINGDDKLMVYDDSLKDVLNLPGAGDDIDDPQFTAKGILFERDGLIEIYNPATELSLKLDDFNLFLSNGVEGAFLPSADLTGTVITAVSGLEENREIVTPCGDLSEFSRALISLNGDVADLSKIDAVAQSNDFLTTMRISSNGRWIVFTTGNGNLYVYDVLHPSVCQITSLPGSGGNFAFDADISPDGSQIVVLVGTVTSTNGTVADPTQVDNVTVNRYDRTTNCWDPMPYANIAENALEVCDPRFMPEDPTKILLEVGVDNAGVTANQRTHGHGVTNTVDVLKVIEYDWATEAVRTLAILNSVNSVNTGDNKISSSGDPNGLNPAHPGAGS